jgi:hypothetical protein
MFPMANPDFDTLQEAVIKLLRKLYPKASEFCISEGSDDITHFIKQVMDTKPKKTHE